MELIHGIAAVLASLSLGLGVLAFRLQQKLHESRLSEAKAEARAAALEEARAALLAQFQAASKQALAENNEQFLSLAQTRFTQAQAEAAQLLTPLREALGKLDAQGQHMRERHGQLSEQLKQMMSLQGTMQHETQRLVEAIRKPAERGRWGEITLRRVLENAGMLMHCDFVEQSQHSDDVGGRHKPDVIINLPDKRCVVIDAKVPFEAYLNATMAANEAERKAHMATHARHVHDHIKQLSSKAYWDKIGGSGSSPEFVIMFIPGESAFSAAVEADPTLLEAGWQKRVVLATPTTLMATLMAVAYSWKQAMLADDAKKAMAITRTLYDRLGTFSKHVQDTGRSLKMAVEKYNSAVGSFEARVLPTARELQSLHLTGTDAPFPAPQQVDVQPRTLVAHDDETA